jgi:adenylate cyclase
MDETTKSRLERLIEVMDRPLLALAIASMGLYLIDLHGLMVPARAVYLLATFLIDSIFVVDLMLKLRVEGMGYVRTPWFLIDLLSCLPLLDVVANGIPGLRAIRFVRGFRILRILRGLRILRALRTIPAFDEFFKEAPAGANPKRFHHAMNVAMIALTAVVLITLVTVRRQMTRESLRRIDSGLEGPLTTGHLRALGGASSPPPTTITSSGSCAWTAARRRHTSTSARSTPGRTRSSSS